MAYELERRLCMRCGEFFTLETFDSLYCFDCKRIEQTVSAKTRYAEMKANGYKPKSWQIRGQKAYITRMSNLYFTDNDRFHILFARLRERSEKKAKQVTRKINARKFSEVNS